MFRDRPIRARPCEHVEDVLAAPARRQGERWASWLLLTMAALLMSAGCSRPCTHSSALATAQYLYGRTQSNASLHSEIPKDERGSRSLADQRAIIAEYCDAANSFLELGLAGCGPECQSVARDLQPPQCDHLDGTHEDFEQALANLVRFTESFPALRRRIEQARGFDTYGAYSWRRNTLIAAAVVLALAAAWTLRRRRRRRVLSRAPSSAETGT